MKTRHAIWSDLLPKGKRNRHRREQYLEVLEVLEELYPKLHEGAQDYILTEEEVEILVGRIMDNSPIHSSYHKLSFLIKGITQGNKKKIWKIPVPIPPKVTRREPPKFTQENFKPLHLVRAIEQAFLEDLGKKFSSPVLRLGQLILSAILRGGLIDANWIEPWARGLSNKNYDHRARWLDMVWIKTVRRNRKKEIFEIPRRWFADPFTKALILRYGDEIPANTNPHEAIATYLNYLGYTNISLPKLIKIIKSFKTSLGLEVSSFLSSHAEGRVSSVSLPPRVWKRLETGKALISDRGIIVEESFVLEMFEFSRVRNRKAKQQLNLLTKFYKKVFPQEKIRSLRADEALPSIKSFQEKHERELSQLLKGLVSWAEDLLTFQEKENMVTGRVKKELRPKTAYDYITKIAKRLIDATDERPFFQLEPDEFHEIYEKIIKSYDGKYKNRNLIGRTFNRFHNFLADRHQVQKVDLSDITPIGTPAELNVNANLVTPEEFERVLQVLACDFSKASYLRKFQYLIAALAFYCGLRHTEVLSLGLSDIRGNRYPYLIVRNNIHARTKSISSERIIPLWLLLPPKILQYLLELRDERKSQERVVTKNTLLFCLPGQSLYLLSDKIFIPICQAIRQITGDSTLRFHHLRHSFATWLTLRLLYDFDEETRSRIHFLKHESFNTDYCAKLRRHLLGKNIFGRQAIYAVTALCGHSSPKMTLLHYFHLCDWLLAYELSSKEKETSLHSETVQELLNLTHNQFFNRRYAKMKLSEVLSAEEDRRLRKKKNAKVDPELTEPDLTPIPEQEDIAIYFDQIFITVYEHFKYMDRTSPNNEFFVKVSTKSEWLDEAKYLSEMRSKYGKQRHVEYYVRKRKPNDFLKRFFKPLHAFDDKALSERINYRVNKILQNKENIPYLRHHIRYFTDNYAADAKGTHFQGEFEKLKEFLKFILDIGVKNKEVHILLRIESGDPRVSEEMVSQLHGEFQIPRESIQYDQECSKNSFWLEVISEPLEDEPQVFHRYGFRYAMYMMAIYFTVHKLEAEGLSKSDS